MTQKTSLTISECMTDKIVSLQTTNSMYLDDLYYKDVLKDDPNDPKKTNFPVKMSVIKIDWIFSEQGRIFLEALAKSENHDLFEQKSVDAIIEYLYYNFKKKVLLVGLPIYLV